MSCAVAPTVVCCTPTYALRLAVDFREPTADRRPLSESAVRAVIVSLAGTAVLGAMLLGLAVSAAVHVSDQTLTRLGVDRWHDAGIKGQGVKVAILDSGFQNYRYFLGKALPSAVSVKSFRRDTNLEAREREAPLRMTHGREFSEDRQFNLAAMTQDGQLLIEETGSHDTLVSVEARGVEAKGVKAAFSERPAAKDAKRKVIRRSVDVTFSLELPARGSVEFIVKLPSPMASPAESP
jgi:hypothetical protein